MIGHRAQLRPRIIVSVGCVLRASDKSLSARCRRASDRRTRGPVNLVYLASRKDATMIIASRNRERVSAESRSSDVSRDSKVWTSWDRIARLESSSSGRSVNGKIVRADRGEPHRRYFDNRMQNSHVNADRNTRARHSPASLLVP